MDTQQNLGIKMRKKGATRTNGSKKKKNRGKQHETQNADGQEKIKKEKTIGRRTKT